MLLLQVKEAAVARQDFDPAIADLMFKSLHLITALWRECLQHDILTVRAEQVLEATESRLRDALEKQSIAEAALALAEVARLKTMLREPFERHDSSPGERDTNPGN